MTRASSPQRRSHGRVVPDRRPAAGERRQAGTGPEPLLVGLHGLGPLIRGAGPPRRPRPIGQQDPGRVGVDQRRGRLDGLVQGGGQVLVGVQVAQGAEAVGQPGRVDGIRGLPVRSPNWRTRSTGQAPRWWPGVPIRPNSPTKSWGLAPPLPGQHDQEPALPPTPHQPTPTRVSRPKQPSRATAATGEHRLQDSRGPSTGYR
jgi:hypothetical protein